MAGTITVKTEMPDGIKQIFFLDNPSKELLIPKLCWREIEYTHNPLQMCIASFKYDERDYIRHYKAFKKIK